MHTLGVAPEPFNRSHLTARRLAEALHGAERAVELLTAADA
ncbi:hypothetical protein [Archangium sp.]|nr:hypothetical protein [Archangium sp.]HYO51278.1 hypothetical protein [Archangium sp.]